MLVAIYIQISVKVFLVAIFRFLISLPITNLLEVGEENGTK